MDFKEALPKDLVARLEKARELLKGEEGTIRLISHYDADGICAAGIITSVLLRENIRFHVSLTKSLKDRYVEDLKKENYSLTILCDMGSGHIKALERFQGNVIVLDHHVAHEDSENPVLINPHFFGIDGTYDACASTLAFMLALTVDENNWDLSAMALAGIMGDKQHLNGLIGFNEYLVTEAKSRGFVEEKKGTKLSGTKLKKGLVENLDPFIRELSGKEDKVRDFLKELDLDPDAEVDDLDESQRRNLNSAIIVKLLWQRVRPELAERFVSERYWLPKWSLYANDLSNYINSAGRMDQMGTGLAVCLGDENALKRAMELRKQYKDELRQGLLRLEAEGAHQMDNIQFIYVENPSLAGAHAGLGMMYLFDQEKPTITLSVLEKDTKVSTRGTRYLISRGLDLAVACREAASEVGGRGGGHPVASGATIPKGKEDAFLELVDYIVGKQFSEDEKPNSS